MLIALDTETTGFDLKKDKIIEIGIVKFEDGKIIDKFQSLINPHFKLTETIKAITNISDDDLAKAPDFEEIKTKIIEFIGNCPIVGHNIKFDINFLNAYGLDLKNPEYDTLPLSLILLPNENTYSLEILTEKLNIEHTAKHRALDDAIASMHLFNCLTEKIEQIDTKTGDEIKILLKKSKWSLKNYFLKNLSKTPVLPIFEELEKIEIKSPIEISLNDQDKLINETFLKSINERKNLICEVGIGVNAFPLSLMDIKDKKILFASNKIQKTKTNGYILNKLNSFLCLKKFEIFKQKKSYTDEEIVFLIKIQLWLDKTETGTKDEIHLHGFDEYILFENLTCQTLNCLTQNCPFKEKCFIFNAINKAKKSNIVVTNQLALASDFIKNLDLNPDSIIINNAEKLEDSFTYEKTVKLIPSDFLNKISNLQNTLSEIEKTLKPEDSGKSIQEILALLDDLSNRFQILSGLLGIFFNKYADTMDYFPKLCITDYHQNTSEWKNICGAMENQKTLIQEILDKIHSIFDPGNIMEKSSPLLFSLFIFTEEFALETTKLFNIIEENLTTSIKWINQTKKNNELIFYKAPLRIKEALNNNIFSQSQNIILVSNNLTINKSFSFIKKNLNLDSSFEEIKINSPLKFNEMIDLEVKNGLPEPNSDGFMQESIKIIYDELINNKGKSLVLFTSKKAIETVYLKLVNDLKKKDILLLAEGLTGGQNKICEMLKKPGNMAIFCTSYFLENLECANDEITLFIIQKLPFMPPTDPVDTARSKIINDSFNNYTIPKTVIKFKENLYRMIKPNKKLRIVILDPRINSKAYGKIFLNSIG